MRWGHVVFAHITEGADDDAYHIMEKCVAADAYADQLVITGNIDLIDSAHGFFFGRNFFAERFKILLADQMRSGLTHGLHIQPIVHPHRPVSHERVPLFMIINKVNVLPAYRAVSSVEITRHIVRVFNRNIPSENAV